MIRQMFLRYPLQRGKTSEKIPKIPLSFFPYRQDKGKNTHCIKKAIPFHNKEQDG